MSESLGIVLVWPSGVQSRARIEVDPDEPLLRVIYFAGCFFEETPEDVEGWPVYVYTRIGEDLVDRKVTVDESA